MCISSNERNNKLTTKEEVTMNEEKNVIEFDEVTTIEQEPDCCWRCGSNGFWAVETIIEDQSVWVHYACTNCSGTWQVGYEASELYIAEQ
ncbi:MAG: hypothetical protein RPR97_11695 [Colwellia sp.]